MSHWPRRVRNRRRRRHFWSKLLLVSFVAHSAVLFSLLFLYKGDYFSYDVTVSTKLLQSGAPVFFMPFHKMVNKQPIVSTVKRTIGTVQKTKISTTKPRKKRTTVAAAPKPKKKLIAKKKQKQNQKKKEKTKVALKKKKEVQKTAQKKTEPAQKRERLAAQVAQPSPDQTPIYVGQVEMEALRMQKQLQREMSQHWKPPVGLTKDLECVLKVLIDWSGNVNGTEVHKSSGVLMYDISARTAVARMQMPQWARGKEFNITFKQ